MDREISLGKGNRIVIGGWGHIIGGLNENEEGNENKRRNMKREN